MVGHRGGNTVVSKIPVKPRHAFRDGARVWKSRGHFWRGPGWGHSELTSISGMHNGPRRKNGVDVGYLLTFQVVMIGDGA